MRSRETFVRCRNWWPNPLGRKPMLAEHEPRLNRIYFSLWHLVWVGEERLSGRGSILAPVSGWDGLAPDGCIPCLCWVVLSDIEEG